MDTQRRLDPLALCVLRALFDLAQHDRPAHAGALAESLGIGRTLAADALVRLDAAGYVRAEYARLTMAGLVLASRLAPAALRAPAPSHDAVFGARRLGRRERWQARAQRGGGAAWQRVTGP